MDISRDCAVLRKVCNGAIALFLTDRIKDTGKEAHDIISITLRWGHLYFVLGVVSLVLFTHLQVTMQICNADLDKRDMHPIHASRGYFE